MDLNRASTSEIKNTIELLDECGFTIADLSTLHYSRIEIVVLYSQWNDWEKESMKIEGIRKERLVTSRHYELQASYARFCMMTGSDATETGYVSGSRKVCSGIVSSTKCISLSEMLSSLDKSLLCA